MDAGHIDESHVRGAAERGQVGREEEAEEEREGTGEENPEAHGGLLGWRQGSWGGLGSRV